MTRHHLRFPIIVAFLAAIVTLVLKTTAYSLTGSVGMLSDAMESVINLVAAATAWISLWYSALPVDSTHTYGHEKIEFFSSGLEGILIIGAALAIAWYAVSRLLVPQELTTLDTGLVVALIASVLNYVVAQILLRVGLREHSIVLEAGGRHLMTDVWTSAAVLGGLLLVRWTGFQALDPILALAISAHIVRTGVVLVLRSFNGLMDHALPEEDLNLVREAIERQLQPDMDYHAMRTRQAGSRRFVDFHLLVPGTLRVHQAHALAVRIEQAIAAVLEGIEVTIHIEPIEEQECWEDSALLPVEQAIRKDQKDKHGA